MLERWIAYPFSPKALILSFVNAVTSLEKSRLGRVILSATWPAPLAATGGKTSAFVIMKPLATPAALLMCYQMSKSKHIRTHKRISGRIEIQMREPAEMDMDGKLLASEFSMGCTCTYT